MASIEAGLKRLGRVVSIDPRARRVAHSYFNNGTLKECDQKTFRDSRPSVRCQRVIVPYLIQVLDRCAPHAVLLPDTRVAGSRERGEIGSQVIRAVAKEALARGIAVHIVGSQFVKESFLNPNGTPAQNRDGIHDAIVKRFPELLSMLPDPREKPWEPEQYFIPLFNTVAMYLAWQGQPMVIEED